jgi:hypothetical protein
LDTTALIEAVNKYHVEDVIGSLVNKGKVTYLVNWRDFLAKID